mmetsp:Transcript_34426/g.83278  ORF Transcript_34426/g.83278 Transcript_34426/m.83278 type:complete len:266 (-) Transcript_34426:398-1195(-)|eukprot:CAMPEP_0114512268 /NCGR_PEP_ID=MMETSP0109-20121206/14875_1 /TAXON_ID=29199 /ORGANISM="Chlorarachnion reptans, Strain CCCM449" /LENGTH=265 /DNA_ID=CAMNT_0001691921 /DNA_START=100 /DNA_END=897 /DNA_ORIENTATION=+
MPIKTTLAVAGCTATALCLFFAPALTGSNSGTLRQSLRSNRAHFLRKDGHVRCGVSPSIRSSVLRVKRPNICYAGDGEDFESSFAREVARRKGSTAEKKEEAQKKIEDAAQRIQRLIDRGPENVRSREPEGSSSKPMPNIRKSAPPPPFAQKRASPPPQFSREPAKPKAARSIFNLFDFDFTDPDYGKPAGQRANIEGEGSIGERSLELAKLFLGFTASFWPVSAAVLLVFGLMYTGFGNILVHGGISSQRQAPSVTKEEMLKDL